MQLLLLIGAMVGPTSIALHFLGFGCFSRICGCSNWSSQGKDGKWHYPLVLFSFTTLIWLFHAEQIVQIWLGVSVSIF